MGFEGKIASDHPNMRTEFAWMFALNADHKHIGNYGGVKDYDHVFIIFPKGQLNLNIVGAKLSNQPNPYSQLLASNIVQTLKQNNKNIYFVQEGPSWIFTDLELPDQLNFINMLNSVDAIFVHNESDTLYYEGLAPHTPVRVMRTLMVDTLVKDIKPETEEKIIIGGNFARWYGGLESYLVANEIDIPIWGQTSHARRDYEEQLITHLPRVMWMDWMKQLSFFKYGVHLMPTVAAGTFALNCAYFGIPCIGNNKVDTQILCHPYLSVNIDDVRSAKSMLRELHSNKDFYEECSRAAKHNYKKYYSVDVWKDRMESILKKL
jgi:nicotinamide riboside kinase